MSRAGKRKRKDSSPNLVIIQTQALSQHQVPDSTLLVGREVRAELEKSLATYSLPAAFTYQEGREVKAGLEKNSKPRRPWEPLNPPLRLRVPIERTQYPLGCLVPNLDWS